MQLAKRVKFSHRYDPGLKREIARRYLQGESSYRITAEEYQLRGGGEVVKHFVRWYRQQQRDQDYLLAREQNAPPPPPPVPAGDPPPDTAT